MDSRARGRRGDPRGARRDLADHRSPRPRPARPPLPAARSHGGGGRIRARRADGVARDLRGDRAGEPRGRDAHATRGRASRGRGDARSRAAPPPRRRLPLRRGGEALRLPLRLDPVARLGARELARPARAVRLRLRPSRRRRRGAARSRRARGEGAGCRQPRPRVPRGRGDGRTPLARGPPDARFRRGGPGDGLERRAARHDGAEGRGQGAAARGRAEPGAGRHGDGRDGHGRTRRGSSRAPTPPSSGSSGYDPAALVGPAAVRPGRRRRGAGPSRRRSPGRPTAGEDGAAACPRGRRASTGTGGSSPSRCRSEWPAPAEGASTPPSFATSRASRTWSTDCSRRKRWRRWDSLRRHRPRLQQHPVRHRRPGRTAARLDQARGWREDAAAIVDRDPARPASTVPPWAAAPSPDEPFD